MNLILSHQKVKKVLTNQRLLYKKVALHGIIRI